MLFFLFVLVFNDWLLLGESYFNATTLSKVINNSIKQNFPRFPSFRFWIGRNRKLGTLGNFRFCSKSYLINLLVFVSAHLFGVFKSWATTSVKIRGKQNFRDFRVFDLGYRSKSKTRKSRKFFFFNWYRNRFRSVHIAQFIFCRFESWGTTTVRIGKKRHIFLKFLSFQSKTRKF